VARTIPILTGDVLALQAADVSARVREADLLDDAMGASLLLSLQGVKLAGNNASLLLWDDPLAKAGLVKLARQIATSGMPAVCDIRTSAAPVRRFQVRGLLLAGDSPCIWCCGTEMSVQDQLIEALKESRTLFRDLVEAAGDFCAEIDSQGIIAYVSPRGALGHEAWMLNGQSVTIFGPAADGLIADVQFGPQDFALLDAFGQRRCLSVVAAPVFSDKRWKGTRLIARDVTEERTIADAMRASHADQLRALEQLSRTDALTGLSNRRAFEEEVQRRVASLERHDGAGSMLLLDLDHFKQLNDTLGHAAGDEALRALASRLGTLLRDTDLVARLGGDELAVWLDGSSALGAERVAITIIEAMEGVRQLFGSGAAPLSVSIGIAEWQRGIEDMHLLMRRADDALYAVKRSGRGTYQLWKNL
jgi:diguanylate cyclase (GGDEF)-like protein/PAS domain S-box-containing protein